MFTGKLHGDAKNPRSVSGRDAIKCVIDADATTTVITKVFRLKDEIWCEVGIGQPYDSVIQKLLWCGPVERLKQY